MKAAGEWGEFFPARFSTFGYNETAAQELYPLTKEEAVAQGFAWEDQERGTFGKENTMFDAEGIDIKTAVFACQQCSKNYRIIPDEMAFYERMGIPLPRLCPDCRHARRIAARGPNKLWPRKCMCAGIKTGEYENTREHFHGSNACVNEFQTPHSPQDAQIIYCEQCYNSEVA
jgi:hypothetical protein